MIIENADTRTMDEGSPIVDASTPIDGRKKQSALSQLATSYKLYHWKECCVKVNVLLPVTIPGVGTVNADGADSPDMLFEQSPHC